MPSSFYLQFIFHVYEINEVHSIGTKNRKTIENTCEIFILDWWWRWNLWEYSQLKKKNYTVSRRHTLINSFQNIYIWFLLEVNKIFYIYLFDTKKKIVLKISVWNILIYLFFYSLRIYVFLLILIISDTFSLIYFL